MALGWQEIKSRAIRFVHEWRDGGSEKADSQTFWNDFFEIFGISRRRVAAFEEPVKKMGDRRGYIDLFWKGTLIVEHKSKGQDLEKAYEQALDYFPGLQEYELPKYVIVTDFDRMRLYDLEESKRHEFHISKLHENISLFYFIAGYRKREFKEEDPVNIQAALLMGELHDALAESGYGGHDLEAFLVRVLFCLFADDTGIFEKGLFGEIIETQTKEDGSDTGGALADIFETLNAPYAERQRNLEENLSKFPYVNGALFKEKLKIAHFDSRMRKKLLQCCYFDWSKISPAVFGSLFQSVMEPKERRNIGAHYTTEQNILKVIKPLFLDELEAEFEKSKNDRRKLEALHNKIASLSFLDPACGCGNFLVITYRELRLLEIKILKRLFDKQRALDIKELSKINIDKMHGIELLEFPARIAEVAMWLVDHQLNMLLSEEFGQYYARLPLNKSAKIHIGNALRMNWEELVPKTQLNYILGNPPFIGKQFQSKEQNADMNVALGDISGSGVLDYVASWYIKAARYIKDTKIRVAFVSTNSITQGEQAGVLWNELFNKYGVKIHFAHRTFAWTSEAKGAANVYVVIIGFAAFNGNGKRIFDYETPKSPPHELKATNINPYLVEGSDFVLLKRRTPLCKFVPPISFGSMPNDGGNLLLTDEEKKELLKSEPQAKPYIRPLISSREYLKGINRWCLWLLDAPAKDIKKLKEVSRRVQAVKKYRQKSERATTRELANFPTLFGEIRQPSTKYIFIPLTTSELRKYIPMDIIPKNKIVNNTASVIPNGSLYHFGVLMSSMHMLWVKNVCGRLKSDYRYSNEIVYNNFPWPLNPTKEKVARTEEKARKILEVRKKFKEHSLADLYDPTFMPPELVKAHKELDKAVEKCYRTAPFKDDLCRFKYLLELYAQYACELPLNGASKMTKKKRLNDG